VNRIFLKGIDFVLARPVVVIAITGMIFLFSVGLLPHLRIDNSVDVFFNTQGRNYIDFEEWKQQFGSDEVIIVALESQDMMSPAHLNLIGRLSRRFEDLEHVDTVTSLTTVNTSIGRDRDFIVEHLLEEIPQDPSALSALKAQATADPLYVKNVISSDGRVAAILIELDRPAEGEGDLYKKTVLDQIQDILRTDVSQEVRYYISGLTAIEHFYAAYMQEDFKAFMPFLFLMIIVVMALSFRSVKLVALPLISIVMSVVCAMALLHLLGFTVNNVTTIIPPILMAIMIADSVHVIGEVLERRRRGEGDALKETIRHLAFPCFLTTATTAAGFWSLTLSTIPPVRQLGLVVGFGVFFALVITLTFLPALAKVWRAFETKQTRPAQEGSPAADRFGRLLLWIGRVNERHYRGIVLASIVLVVMSVVGVLKIKAETSVIEYFKKSSTIYQATVFVEDHLSGVHTLNISLRSKEPDYFQSPKALKDIADITEFLYSIPEVDKVSSVNDYLKEINKSFHNEDALFYRLPESQRMTAQYGLLYGRQDLEDFMDDPWQWATIRVRLKEHSTVVLADVIADIQDFLARYNAGTLDARVVGQTALEVESNNRVAEGQIKSLGLAMLVIFGMMFLVFKSVPLGLVSMIPNALPILMNFGLMGFLGIRLDSATSMIAAIGIGIVVDDTIHFLHGFSEALARNGRDYVKAVYGTLSERGRPIILTSVILFFGFGILSVSRFVPTAYFGLLSAVLMVNALIADLFVLPSVLIWMKPPLQGGGR